MIGLRSLRCAALVAWLGLLLPLRTCAQEPPPSTSTTTLSSGSPTLTLPGSLTLTSVVAAPNGGGVPTGPMNFSYDTNHPLGTATLAILPATQAFPAAPSNSFQFGAAPFAFWAASLFSATEVDLATSDLNQVGPIGGPILTIFPGLGRGGFNTAAQIVNTFPAGYFIDAISSGGFINNGHQEFLVHSRNFSSAPGQYDVINGALTDTPIPIPACVSTDLNCNVNDPDSETLIVDDFTGDGFADVASLTSRAPTTINADAVITVLQPHIRIAVNNGNAGAVGLTFGANVTLPTFPDPNQNGVTDRYCPVAIASGQFRNNGKKDLISVGTTSIYTVISASPENDCGLPSTLGYLVLMLGDGTGGLTSQTPIKLGHSPSAVGTGDFNQDGKLDVVVADSVDNTVEILYGNGDGTFATQTFTISAGNGTRVLRVADFNSDGYPDIAISDGADGNIYLLLNDKTGKLLSPHVLYTASQSPIAFLAQDINGDGLPDLTALLPPSAANPGQVANPGQGTVEAFLNSASAQAVLATAPQTLPAGSHTVIAAFPGDGNFNASTSAGVAVTVSQTTPAIVWQPPTAIAYGTPLGATQLDASTTVPGIFNYSPGSGTVLPVGTSTLSVAFAPTDGFDYTTATASAPITVTPPTPVATASGPQTSDPGTQPSIQLSLNPYPVPLTVTLTLTFAPAPPNTAGDPAVLFSNGTPVDTFVIPANLTAAIAPISLQSGTTAGTITVTVQFTAAGLNVTPAGFAPITIVVPAVAPTINSATLSRNGDAMQLVITGFSSPRNMTQAQFHFTPAPGVKLNTTDLTVPLTGAFTAWYQNEASTAFGTSFQYTQPFTLNEPATDIENVTLTLTNSQGASQPASAQ